MSTSKIQIDLSGWPIDKFIIDGYGNSLFVAIGCSWTRAWGSFPDCIDFRDNNYRDDLDFYNNKSYVGRVCNYLKYHAKICMAIPGSNNDMQIRLLIELLQKNRSKFDKIFVLWGITSHLRWELYSNNVDAPTMFMMGSKVPPGKEEERKWFITRHWNDAFELERLSQKIVTTSTYLKNLDVDHLFFPTFESYNSNNMNLNYVDDGNFFRPKDSVNDMLHLWAQHEKLHVPDNILSNPYSEKDVLQLDKLIKLNYLSKKLAHPTEKGHEDIANRLISYLEETR